MNLGNLVTLSRLSVPAAKSSRVTPTILTLIINEVCKDINFRLFLLQTDEKFNVAADQYKYDLSDSDETVDRFGKIDKMGLWWNSGTAASPNWKRLIRKTMKYLDNNFEGWRDQDASDPIYYAKHGKFIVTYPTADTALTNGFWLYFIEQTIAMSKSTDYPFGNTVEMTEFSTLTNCIIAGVKAWILAPVGKKPQGSQAFAEYIAMVEMNRAILKINLDLQTEKDVRIKLKRVC